MKIQELRIGNIVMVDNPKYHPRLDGIPLRVTGFEERVISSRSDHVVRLEHIKQKPNSFYESYSQFLKFIKPIPLTEEVLLKCGFEKIENNWKVSNLFFCQLNWERLAGMTLAIEDVSIYMPHIIYLHQLQNLFFDLTGEELEVNL